jgi:hypothetical protein
MSSKLKNTECYVVVSTSSCQAALLKTVDYSSPAHSTSEEVLHRNVNSSLMIAWMLMV